MSSLYWFLQVAEQGIGPVLGAISQAGSIVKMLQAHYMKAIAPALEEAPQISQACSKRFAAMLRATEDRIIGTLESAISDFFTTVSLCTFPNSKSLHCPQ